VITISIWHRGKNFVIAGSSAAKNHIWNERHHLTDVELAHRPSPIKPLLNPQQTL
jgi:hypothetical protein